MSSYSAFAYVYDQLTSNIDYQERARYFDALIQKYNGKKAILLDAACGTGSLSEEFSRLGYEVIGTDSSSDMLSVAQEKKLDNGLDIVYLNQALENLDLYGTVDAAVCALDSLNHITDSGVLQQAFQKISLFLHPEGVFVFDVNTIYKHEHILKDHTYVYDLDDVYCVWQNSQKANHCIQIHLDLFFKDGDTYSRDEETFEERAYSCEEIGRFLENAGLEAVAVYEGDTLESPKEATQRLVYVTRKVSK